MEVIAIAVLCSSVHRATENAVSVKWTVLCSDSILFLRFAGSGSFQRAWPTRTVTVVIGVITFVSEAILILFGIIGTTAVLIVVLKIILNIWNLIMLKAIKMVVLKLQLSRWIASKFPLVVAMFLIWALWRKAKTGMEASSEQSAESSPKKK